MEKDKTLLFVILGALGVFLIAIIIGFIFLGKSIKGISKPASSQYSPPTAEMGPIYDLGDITVNLGDNTHFLKTTITLELITDEEKKKDPKAGEELKKDVEQKVPKLKDKIISVLSQLKIEQLTQPNSQDKIKARLLEEIRRLAGKNKIRQVYFTAFVYEWNVD